MKINIKTIPHDTQRYSTCGDWWFSDDTLEIRVSNLGNEVWEWLIAEHEINEAIMCRSEKVEEKSVSNFDISFEIIRKLYPDIIGDQEPGDMINAPYNKMHIKATNIEKLSASYHNVNWKDYSNTINEL